MKKRRANIVSIDGVRKKNGVKRMKTEPENHNYENQKACSSKSVHKMWLQAIIDTVLSRFRGRTVIFDMQMVKYCSN